MPIIYVLKPYVEDEVTPAVALSLSQDYLYNLLKNIENDNSYEIYHKWKKDITRYECVPIDIYTYDSNRNVIKYNGDIDFSSDFKLIACYNGDDMNESLFYCRSNEESGLKWCSNNPVILNKFYEEGIMNA
jgi:hypothetical protein